MNVMSTDRKDDSLPFSRVSFKWNKKTKPQRKVHYLNNKFISLIKILNKKKEQTSSQNESFLCI